MTVCCGEAGSLVNALWIQGKENADSGTGMLSKARGVNPKQKRHPQLEEGVNVFWHWLGVCHSGK